MYMTNETTYALLGQIEATLAFLGAQILTVDHLD